ncbi:PSME3-interacting protein-like isoform X1 [Xenia sp. Carnegie-2017]|uniref:PSME3-interacting protein-like isoform X1 n=1 Tax=Xenia sp. Carnegie-2017 TaxID=2897299 RepID=UPI001F04615D|nr:PSME3-interacting protein-like isoform X1 [Xenia sp. Carnegie-2017]
MSFKKTNNSKIKSFVTEEEAQDAKEKRQKEWERVRKPDDPLECPDVQPKSLFEQLQAQKEKAQQEHDEKYDIKKMFRGIDNDEAVFLEFASKQQAEVDRRRFALTPEIKDYRDEVAKFNMTVAVSTPAAVGKEKASNALLGKKKSQLELLAGCIKRRRSDVETSEDEKSDDQNFSKKEPAVEKSSQNEENFEKTSECKNSDTETKHFPQTAKKAQEKDENGSVAYNLGFIASLGDYSDSSDSESSSSDSDILPSLLSNIESKPTN